MDDWEKFNETSLPEKEDYVHAKRVYKDLEIKNLREYHEFYVQSDTLFFADVFGNFRNMS